MRRISNESDLDGLGACIALGMFDGVHKGHVVLINTCVARARAANVPSVLYTYRNSPHPDKHAEVLGYLTPEEEKLALCESMGIDIALTLQFTDAYRHMPAEEFAQLLIQNGRASVLFCGNDYRFGYRGKGTPALLQLTGADNRVEVVCVDDVLDQGVPISSTRIRKALRQGDCELAQRLLGRPFGIHVHFQNGIARYPLEKARVAAGIYACVYEDKELSVRISNNGTVQCLDVLPANTDGILLLLHYTKL